MAERWLRTRVKCAGYHGLWHKGTTYVGYPQHVLSMSVMVIIVLHYCYILFEEDSVIAKACKNLSILS